jgi:HSP20 family protein
MGRTLPLPDGALQSDITATYKDGILQIRLPVRPVSRSEPTRIAVRRG